VAVEAAVVAEAAAVEVVGEEGEVAELVGARGREAAEVGDEVGVAMRWGFSGLLC